MMKEGYYYAIVDGEEKIVEKRKGLKYPYLSGFCCEREYRLLGCVPNFTESQLINSKFKIRKCCQNCKYYECWDEEDGDYGCELTFEKNDIGNYWDSYDKTDCKYFEINAEKLKDAFVCDEMEAKDE